MGIIEISKTEVDKIKPLWESLNKTHNDKSSHWKKHFSKQTFEQRFQELLGSVDICSDDKLIQTVIVCLGKRRF